MTSGLVIIVVDYDPSWPERFNALRDEYAGATAAAGVPAERASIAANQVPSHDELPR